MTPELSIDPQTGAVLFSGLAIAIAPGQEKAEVESLLKPYFRDSRDFQNGYEWLTFEGLSFGGEPCVLSFCFFQGRVSQVSWGVKLPGAKLEGGWPARETSGEEIKFVRKNLKEQLSRGFQHGSETFGWGSVHSVFDDRGGAASSAIRYERRKGWRSRLFGS